MKYNDNFSDKYGFRIFNKIDTNIRLKIYPQWKPEINGIITNIIVFSDNKNYEGQDYDAIYCLRTVFNVSSLYCLINKNKRDTKYHLKKIETYIIDQVKKSFNINLGSPIHNIYLLNAFGCKIYIYGMKTKKSKLFRETDTTILNEPLGHKMKEYVYFVKFDHDFNIVGIDLECDILYSNIVPVIRIKNIQNDTSNIQPTTQPTIQTIIQPTTQTVTSTTIQPATQTVTQPLQNEVKKTDNIFSSGFTTDTSSFQNPFQNAFSTTNTSSFQNSFTSGTPFQNIFAQNENDKKNDHNIFSFSK